MEIEDLSFFLHTFSIYFYEQLKLLDIFVMQNILFSLYLQYLLFVFLNYLENIYIVSNVSKVVKRRSKIELN